MWWDNKNDGEGMQILKNRTFLHLPVTNKTRNEMGCGPVILIALVIGTLATVALAAM